jgi:hypothetical protein
VEETLFESNRKRILKPQVLLYDNFTSLLEFVFSDRHSKPAQQQKPNPFSPYVTV